jgi:leader peptidase (prepilin peptidase)/N-methyltransferase
MLTVIAAGAGLILGSFLSVLLERLGRRGGIVSGRSECPHCHHILAWYDLIPLASYVMLAGRCRYCGKRISPLYPAVELTMAAVLGSYVFRWGIPSTWHLADLVLLFGLVALFFFDLKHRILPDVIVYPMSIITLVRLASERPDLLVNAVTMGVALGGLFGLLWAYSRGRWIGMGDVKLAVVIGLLFGFPGAVGVTLAAIWVGALCGVGLILAGRANMQTALPFGSFWTAAAIITIIWPGPIFFLSGLLIPALR